jgi:hypothetical protein
MAHLREAQENPTWKLEAERQQTGRERIAAARPASAPVHGRFHRRASEILEGVSVPDLPATIELLPGNVTMQCRDMEHLWSTWSNSPKQWTTTTKLAAPDRATNSAAPRYI